MPGFLSQEAARAIGTTAAAAIAWRFKGELWVTAIVKATFGFADDTAMARLAPQAIVADELPDGSGTGQGIRFTSDLVPYRKRADVLFTGCAHAPPGGPVESMMVRLGVFVGEAPRLDKELLLQRAGGFQRIQLTGAQGLGALSAVYQPQGYNLGWNLGRIAGAGVVDHVHLHAVPRWAGDTNFMPVLADVKVLPEHLSETRRRIVDAWPR